MLWFVIFANLEFNLLKNNANCVYLPALIWRKKPEFFVSDEEH